MIKFDIFLVVLLSLRSTVVVPVLSPVRVRILLLYAALTIDFWFEVALTFPEAFDTRSDVVEPTFSVADAGVTCKEA